MTLLKNWKSISQSKVNLFTTHCTPPSQWSFSFYLREQTILINYFCILQRISRVSLVHARCATTRRSSISQFNHQFYSLPFLPVDVHLIEMHILTGWMVGSRQAGKKAAFPLHERLEHFFLCEFHFVENFVCFSIFYRELDWTNCNLLIDWNWSELCIEWN